MVCSETEQFWTRGSEHSNLRVTCLEEGRVGEPINNSNQALLAVQKTPSAVPQLYKRYESIGSLKVVWPSLPEGRSLVDSCLNSCLISCCLDTQKPNNGYVDGSGIL